LKYDSRLCKRFGNDVEDVRVPEIYPICFLIASVAHISFDAGALQIVPKRLFFGLKGDML